MKKTLILLAVGLAGVVVLAKMTNLGSYTGTLWSQSRTEAKRMVPTKFEIERIRHEIASLDQDVNKMIRPIAEYKVAIDRLHKDVDKTAANVEEQRKVLLGVTEDLKTGAKELKYGGKSYPREEVKARLARDFDSFKRVEAQLASQRKLLESKEMALKSSQEQLAKVLSVKKDYEVRLAQLEAENEALVVSSIGNDIRFDTSRAANIDQSLRELEDRIAAAAEAQELQKGVFSAGIPFNQRGTQNVDLDSIQAHLQGEAAKTTSTASNDK